MKHTKGLYKVGRDKGGYQGVRKGLITFCQKTQGINNGTFYKTRVTANYLRWFLSSSPELKVPEKYL